MSLHITKGQAPIGFGKEKETKFVGRRQLADPFTLERLAKEINHETGLPQATAEIVLRYMVHAVEDAIKDGRSVDLGIGHLSPTISTIAADTADEVKIRKKRILFRPSKQLREIVNNMSIRFIGEDDDDDEDIDNSQGGSSSTDGGGQQGGSSTPGGNTTGGDDTLQP